MMARTAEEVTVQTQTGTNACSFTGISGQFGAILIDPPWRFANRTGKVGPEHTRLHRYRTLSFEAITALPVARFALPRSHLYLWCPNALLLEALTIMKAWGFTYKTNLVWYKIRQDGGPDGRGVGFYFRNVTELLLFGVKGHLRTLAPGRTQVNLFMSRKGDHSRKPVAVYDLIARCRPGPYLELFARDRRDGWTQWGDEVGTSPQGRPLSPPDDGARPCTTCSRHRAIMTPQRAMINHEPLDHQPASNLPSHLGARPPRA
jgi:N6-adenosine-specific RNA methylase IME4